MDSEYYEFINKNYKQILKENEELKNKIRELSTVKNTLMAVIEHKDKTIEELQRENTELKLRITVLEKELADTKHELEDTKKELADTKKELNETKQELADTKKELEETNKELADTKHELEETKKELADTKHELEETKKELTTVKDSVNKMMNNTLYKKIIMGIQDYNALEMLEKQMTDPTELQYLRDDRVDECHYINKKHNPTKQEQDIKINILIDKINTAPKCVLDMYENIYPSLLQQLEPFLVKRVIVEDERIIRRANAWWDT